MELLTSPKFEYLLQAGIPVLHAESREWMEEIAFINDESKFFKKLLNIFSKDPALTKEKVGLEALLKADQPFGENVLQDLETEINAHEQYLSRLIQDGNVEDQGKYRWQHERLKSRVEKIKEEFKTYKKSFYALILKHP